MVGLEVEDLQVRARSGRVLLAVPSLSVPAGRALGVRGASGAGKSTFLFALMGLADGAEGRVRWGETDVLSLSDAARAEFRRTRMGMIFQDFLLFDELSAGGNAAIRGLFSPKAERAGLAEAAAGLLTRLDVAAEARTVATFSGGERQRVAVARALAHDPAIVLADEPTASLHREAGEALTDALLTRAREAGTTVVVASHDPQVLERMDEVLTLEHGQVSV
ncbi:MAG: ATP-binding cassette domain-containing protein [Pseudomonadota bacterium]